MLPMLLDTSVTYLPGCSLIDSNILKAGPLESSPEGDDVDHAGNTRRVPTKKRVASASRLRERLLLTQRRARVGVARKPYVRPPASKLPTTTPLVLMPNARVIAAFGTSKEIKPSSVRINP